MEVVHAVDFFTPIVDDPFTFGQIAAANSLSDVYAMGGKPVSALSIVGFPDKGEPDILEQIIRGGLSKMAEGNCSFIGGPSLLNYGIKFGYGTSVPTKTQGDRRAVCACARAALSLSETSRSGALATTLE